MKINKGDGTIESKINTIVKEIIYKNSSDGNTLTKDETYNFLIDFIRQVNKSAELSTGAFDELFNLIDTDKDGIISKDEITNFVNSTVGIT